MDAQLIPHPGPDAAPASAAGTGVFNATCLRFSAPGDTSRPLTLAWPTDLVGERVGADAVLEWAVFPEFDHEAAAPLDGFRACATGIEVTLDDGTALPRPGQAEVDELSSSAADRAGIDWPEQWNHRRLDLSDAVGRRIAAVRLVLAPRTPGGAVGEELVGWVDGPRLGRPEPLPDSPAERAITTRGSHSSPQRSRGLNAPLTGVPHGGAYLSPATRLTEQSWTYSWSAHGTSHLPGLAGMLITRAPSIWIGDRGALGIRFGSTLGPDGISPEPFHHDDEVARPHRYRVTTRSGIAVDAAATSHGGTMQLEFPEGGWLSLTAPGGTIGHVESAAVDDGVAIGLSLNTGNPYEPDLRAYVALHLGGTAIEPATSPDGDPTFRVGPGALSVAYGTSFISIDQAEYVRGGLAGRNVDDVAASARDQWDEYLSLVELPSASDEARRAIASDLYRLFLYPTAHHEHTPDGDRYADPIHKGDPDGDRHTGRAVREGRFLTDHGFWDTYRTCWPAFHLLAPERAGDLVDGFLEHVRISGWSARWSAGSPLDAMVGTSLDIVTSDALAAGIDFDVELAYAAALRNATCASAEKRFGRADMPGALFRGYMSAAIGESVSWTLEGAINDAGTAALARHLARLATDDEVAARLRAEARYLAGRAMDYDRLLDPETLFFRPRTEGGVFADRPFDPRTWGGGHTETNAWGSRFGAPHDGVGLAALFGGPEALGDALDALFAEPETARPEFSGSYGFVIHEMSEARDLRLGMCGLSNQPAHHVPWMYAFSDRPHRASEVTREAVARLFLGQHLGQGFPGDEDNGEMSAWHLLATVGLVPLQVGSGELLIVAPTVSEAVVKPIGAPSFTITAVGSGGHISAVTLDGEPWASPTIPIRRLHAARSLVIALDEEPTNWSGPMPAASFFAPDDQPARRWGDVLAHARVDHLPHPSLTDDRGDHEVRLRDRAVVDLALRTPVEGLVQLTLTLAGPGRHGFTVRHRVDGEWVDVAACHDEPWEWSAQTRPFDLLLPRPVDALRLLWHSGARLRQIQVLAPR